MSPVTEECYNALSVGKWPLLSTQCEFGLDGAGNGSTDQERYDALQNAIESGCPKSALNRVKGDSSKIMRLIRKYADKEFHSVVFCTVYDELKAEQQLKNRRRT